MNNKDIINSIIKEDIKLNICDCVATSISTLIGDEIPQRPQRNKQ